ARPVSDRRRLDFRTRPVSPFAHPRCLAPRRLGAVRRVSCGCCRGPRHRTQSVETVATPAGRTRPGIGEGVGTSNAPDKEGLSGGRLGEGAGAMARIVLGVTGSVAAVRTPALYESLCAAGHAVRLVATEPSLYFFDPSALAATGDDPDFPGGPVFRD